MAQGGSKTDRSDTGSNCGTMGNKTERADLLAKKKSYSQLIRERNMQNLNKKKRHYT